MARRIHPTEPLNTSPSWRLSLKESALESPRADVIRLSMRVAGLIKRLHLAPHQTLETTLVLKYFALPATKEGKTLLIGKMAINCSSTSRSFNLGGGFQSSWR
jgi:hypothetical protein